jgi:2-C-methyl-D-erythritol 4-phosphate cytidylyltransferase/2-C-methyl-D-erythritol 2,4-cyclodiphosphate synthase
MKRPATAWAVVVAAGEGVRFRRGPFAGGPRKVFVDLGGRLILLRTLEAVAACPDVERVVVVVAADEVKAAESLVASDRERLRVASIVPGGARRQDSVAAGLACVPEEVEIVAVHDGARPLVNPALFSKSIEAAARCGGAVVALPVVETLKRIEERADALIIETVDRSRLWAAQTPQTFRASDLRRLLREAEAKGVSVTDDASLFERAGLPVVPVPGERRNIKITTPEDFEMAEALIASELGGNVRVGTGDDIHRLVPTAQTGRRLVVCGVEVESDLGAEGHSDADTACHAVIDAMLGACALGDVGRLFPDTDPAFKDVDSLKLLEEATRRVRQAGFEPRSVDVTVLLERPKIASLIQDMRRKLARATGLEEPAVSVKAKTAEGLGPVGEGKAIEAHAVAAVVARSRGAALTR